MKMKNVFMWVDGAQIHWQSKQWQTGGGASVVWA